MLCLLAFQQAFFAVNAPTRSAAIPRMRPGSELPPANALNMTVTQFGAIAGPLLAGVLINWVNLATLYLIDTVTCLAPIWATYRPTPMPAGVHPDADGASRWGMRAVFDGFRYLAGHIIVLMSFVADLIAMIFGMPRALFPQIAHQSFGGPRRGRFGDGVAGRGDVRRRGGGRVFSGWLPRVRRQGMAVMVAIVAWGVAMVGFGLASGQAHGHAVLLWAALAFLALGGTADMVSSAFRQTILQQAASDEVVGRLQGVFTVVVGGGPRVADAVHGAAGAVIGTSAAAAGGGALVVLGVGIAALAAPAFIRYRSPEVVSRRDRQQVT